jgi:tetratricopeptide (TPR) repeat protein
MPQLGKGPNDELVQTKLSNMMDTFEDNKDAGNFRIAASIAEKAIQLADATGLKADALSIRRRRAAALRMSGQYQAAFNELSPIFREGSCDDESILLDALLEALQLSIEMPTSLKVIEGILRRADGLLYHESGSNLRSGFMLSKAQILYYRGLNAEALPIAQEAWVLKKAGGKGWSWDSYLHVLVDICLELDREDLTLRYLKDWEQRDKAGTQVVRYLLMESKALRWSGKYAEAAKAARRLLVHAEGLEAPSAVTGARDALVRSQIMLGDICSVRSRLLARPRHGSPRERFTWFCLWGDYHLACARRMAGMKPVDDEFCRVIPLPSRIGDAAGTRTELRRAEFAYRGALRLGSKIDDLLECKFRQKLVAQRLQRLADLSAVL